MTMGERKASSIGAPDDPYAPPRIDCAKAIEEMAGLKTGDLSLEGLNAEKLKSLISYYEKDQFEAVWAIVSKIGPPTKLANPWTQLMLRRMVEDGDQDSLARAIRAIQESRGPGDKANQWISSAFESSPLSQGQFAVAKSLEDPTERGMALDAIARVLAYRPDLSAIDPVWLGGMNSDDAQRVVLGIANRVSQAASLGKERAAVLQENLEFIKRLADQKIVAPDSAGLMLARASQASPFESWDAIKGDLGSYQGSTVGEIAINMTRADAGKAMDLLVASAGSGALPAGAISQAMGQFLNDDSREAGQWYEDHRTSLAAAQNDAARLALVKFSLAKGDPQKAGEWARDLKTPEGREAAREILQK